METYIEDSDNIDFIKLCFDNRDDTIFTTRLESGDELAVLLNAHTFSNVIDPAQQMTFWCKSFEHEDFLNSILDATAPTLTNVKLISFTATSFYVCKNILTNHGFSFTSDDHFEMIEHGDKTYVGYSTIEITA